MFINREMQNLAAHLSQIVKRWYPEKYASMPAKSGKHRALDGILESIQELKWYCQNEDKRVSSFKIQSDPYKYYCC
ncbi:unnamed protein product [Dracunculus medinensis]|uniref:Oligoribonuclease n=1 Tax=Dracunculus medinensis TaxID=318479 RepID=A0A158Q2Y9_DRAME|nr:unnamed protein product [Dracunculus medinensis]